MSQATEIQRVQQAREALDAGATIHTLTPDIKPDITNMLAGEYGVYTTSVDQPREVESFGAFVMAAETRRATGDIADRTERAMRQVPGYEVAVQVGYLATRLSTVLSTVTGIGRAENVRVTDPNQPRGAVGASRMRFVVPTEDDAWLVQGAFLGMMRAPETVYPPYISSNDDGTRTISLFNPNEYATREFGSSLDAVMAREDGAKRDTILPPDKISYAEWRKRGETFRPDVGARLAAADAAYQRLKASLVTNGAEYPGYPELRPDLDDHLLGTDIAPVLQAKRNIFNALIKELRGEAASNLPQNPDRGARLHSHGGVELTRDPLSDGSRPLGPSRDRTHSVMERLIAKGKLTAEETKNRPFLALLKLAGRVTMGLQDLVLSAAERMPSFTKAAKQYAENARAWKRHKQEVAEARAQVQDKLRDKIARLILEEDAASQQRS